MVGTINTYLRTNFEHNPTHRSLQPKNGIPPSAPVHIKNPLSKFKHIQNLTNETTILGLKNGRFNIFLRRKFITGTNPSGELYINQILLFLVFKTRTSFRKAAPFQTIFN